MKGEGLKVDGQIVKIKGKRSNVQKSKDKKEERKRGGGIGPQRYGRFGKESYLTVSDNI